MQGEIYSSGVSNERENVRKGNLKRGRLKSIEPAFYPERNEGLRRAALCVAVEGLIAGLVPSFPGR